MTDTKTKTKKARTPQPVTAYKAVQHFCKEYGLTEDKPIKNLLDELKGAIVERAIG